MKSKKNSLYQKSFQGKLRYQYEETTHHISALVGITASGNVLPPCALITTILFFKENGNFPAVSNDKSKIDESVILDDLLLEENSLCMKCKKIKDVAICFIVDIKYSAMNAQKKL